MYAMLVYVCGCATGRKAGKGIVMLSMMMFLVMVVTLVVVTWAVQGASLASVPSPKRRVQRHTWESNRRHFPKVADNSSCIKGNLPKMQKDIVAAIRREVRAACKAARAAANAQARAEAAARRIRQLSKRERKARVWASGRTVVRQGPVRVARVASPVSSRGYDYVTHAEVRASNLLKLETGRAVLINLADRRQDKRAAASERRRWALAQSRAVQALMQDNLQENWADQLVHALTGMDLSAAIVCDQAVVSAARAA